MIGHLPGEEEKQREKMTEEKTRGEGRREIRE